MQVFMYFLHLVPPVTPHYIIAVKALYIILPALTPGVHVPGHGLQLKQLGVDVLLGLLQDVDQLLGLLGVAGGEEGVGGAGVLGPSRAADAVNVVLRVAGEVEVDHVLDVRDVCGERNKSEREHRALRLIFGT